MLLLLVSSLFTASSAIFFPLINLPGQQQQSMMNVCIYSENPNRYQPKCFLCPSTVYPNVLRACLDRAAIPRNITYAQAMCIEQNCAIRRGKRSVDVNGKPPVHSNQLLLTDDGGNKNHTEEHSSVKHQDFESGEDLLSREEDKEEFFAADWMDYETDYEE